ncbi:unnamed protein product [Sphagnum troendelagicum]
MEAEKKGRMQIGMGEVKWEELGEGRVRCVETGHEMLESEKNFYLSTKKCRRALFDIALLQRKPPLHLFQQSPISRDKVICDLTGAVLNKQEEALWKHMMGKKFQHKLEEKEAEKKAAKDKTNGGQSDQSVAEQESEKATSLPSKGIKSEGKKMKKKQQEKEVRELDVDANTHSNMEMDREDSTSEEDFWVPPVGDRWDMDSGGPDRWTNAVPGAHRQKSLDNKSDSEMDLEIGSEKEDREQCGSEDGNPVDAVKRTSRAAGRSSFAGHKKKRKVLG